MHTLDDHALPGIGPGRRRRLTDAGVLTLQDLVELGVDGVASLPHIPRSVAESAVLAAAAIVSASRGEARPDAVPEPQTRDAAEPPKPPAQRAQPQKVDKAPSALSEALPPAQVIGSNQATRNDAPAMKTKKAPGKGKPGAEQPKKAKNAKKAKKAKKAAPKKGRAEKAKTAPKRKAKSKRKKAELPGLLTDAQRHAGDAKKGKQRRKLQGALQKLGDTLDRLPKRMKKLSKKRRARVAKHLGSIEKALRTLVVRKPRSARLRKARRQVEAAHTAVRSETT